MSESILILGGSGNGKSYSLRNLDPKKSMIVSVDGKRLPFKMKEWGKFSSDNLDGSFYIPPKENLYGCVKGAMKKAAELGKKIIVVDDSQYMLANSFFKRALERGFDKFNELGHDFWMFLDFTRSLPDDVIVYLMHHTDVNDMGEIKPKTIGKMLDDKGCVEGKFSICLLAKKTDGEFKFHSRIDNQPVIKAPPEMFEPPVIDNDIVVVDNSIREFYGMEL